MKPTPVGLFHTSWKDKERISTIDEAWLLHWYLNLHNFDGVSMHEYELPGRSGEPFCACGCSRRDAIRAHARAEEWRIAKDRRTVLREGTPVVVFGEWDWNGRAPWKRLAGASLATRLGDDEIEESLRVLREAVRPRFGVIDSDREVAAGAAKDEGPSRHEPRRPVAPRGADPRLQHAHAERLR